MDIDLKGIQDFVIHLIEKGQLSAFLIGMLIGAGLVGWLNRWIRGRMPVGLVQELRGRIAQTETSARVLERDNAGLKEQMALLARERDLLMDRVKVQEGAIEAHRQRVEETSAVCERLTSENYEARERLKREKKALRDVQRVAKAQSSQLDDITNSDGKIWLKAPEGRVTPFLPLGQRRTAIISLANLKGGVGKTTLAANLGAALASQGLRVLMIDLDHQSSLTNLCLSSAESTEVRRAHRYIDDLFEDGGDLVHLNRCVTRLQTPTGAGQFYLAPTEEAFSDVENQLMTRWHSGVLKDDVRFRLRAALHVPDLRDHYDVVLIDCPPRLTTGCINALAASDYVLIPVLLEDTSAEAVPRILGWLKKFRATSCIDLNVLGVVGNKAFPRKRLIQREAIIWDALRKKCRDVWGDEIHLFDEVIREHSSVMGRFAALDPRHQDRYRTLIDQIRQEIPHARLQPATIPATAGAAPESGGD